MRRLVIAAHPDDEVLGCGGSVRRFASDGDSVAIAIFGEGLRSRETEEQKTDDDAVNRLHKVSEQVANKLGSTDFYSFRFPDNRFDTVSLLDIVKKLEELIQTFRPEVIYTHSGGDLNVDHQVLHRATLTATRPMKDSILREVYAYEVSSSTEWGFGQLAPIFQPNTFVDISSSLETKIECMESYESEAREFPHPRSPEALRAIATRWGSVAGCEAAEAFQLIRRIL